MDTQSRPTLLITRPQAQAEAFARVVDDVYPAKWAFEFAPLLEIIPLNAAVDLTDVHTLVFTSANGVRAFSAATDRRDVPALCVGQTTAEVAEQAGIAVQFAAPDARSLLDVIISRPKPPGQAQFLHVRGVHQSVKLAEELQKAAIPARELVLYDQNEKPLPQHVLLRLHDGEIDTVTLFSQRTARIFVKQSSSIKLPETLRVICLSDAVAVPFRGKQVRVEVAAKPDQSSIIALL